jgi:hypothetical protein
MLERAFSVFPLTLLAKYLGHQERVYARKTCVGHYIGEGLTIERSLPRRLNKVMMGRGLHHTIIIHQDWYNMSG